MYEIEDKLQEFSFNDPQSLLNCNKSILITELKHSDTCQIHNNQPVLILDFYSYEHEDLKNKYLGDYDKYLVDYYKSLETKRCSCKNVISGYCVTDILKWTYL